MKRLSLLCLLAALPTMRADPQLDSWFTANSGKYARLYQTTANETARTTSTTWSRGTGTQTNPVYADVNEIRYSANWVYIRTPGLASHVMGPWYLDANKTQNFPNFPSNTAVVYRIPRNPTIPTTKTLTGLGATGRMVNGVSMFDSRDAFSYVNASATDATPVNGLTGDGVWNRDGYHNEGVTFDPALAHQAGNNYHYHAQPIGLRHQLGDHVDYNPLTNRYTERAGTPAEHSPIVAWAADGLPVYGPYGYSSPMDPNSGLRRMVSGFTLRNGQNGTAAITVRQVLPLWAQRVQNRTTLAANQYGPAVNATYLLGHYIEDFDYRGDLGQTLGVDFDLNEQNVRFCVTPDYPSGTWAYFTTINADGTPAYPYTTGRQYYGAVTGGASSLAVMNADTPQTVHFLGGASSALNITATNVVGSTVTLAWSTVEGGTYAVEASPNQTTWTSKATGIVATGIATNRSYTALGATGTEYGRVSRTALATYDTNGSAAATVAQNRIASYLLGGVDTPPTISAINDLSTAINIPTAALPFTIGDGETPAANLLLSVTSDNLLLVPVANVAFGGSGSNRTVTVTPAASRTGTAQLMVTISDGVNTATESFTLTVTGTNTAPTLGTLADQSILQNGTTGALALTVGDGESTAGSLVLTGASSNPTLVPVANIVFGGGGAARTVTVTPAAGLVGSASITVTVSDGALTASTSFLLTVTSSAPVVADISHFPAPPTPAEAVTVSARVVPANGRTISTVQLNYVIGGSSTSTVFNETMAAAAAVAWTGAAVNNPWTVAFTGPPASPFAQTAVANHTPVGQGNQMGMEITANAPNIANSTLTTTNPINAAGSAGYVEFWMSSSGLTGTQGWDFQTSPNGTTYTTRLSELTGSNHGYQLYRYDLSAAERVGTLRLRFRFAGPGANNVPRVNLDDIKVVVTTGTPPVTVAMLDNGLSGDGAASDGVYGAAIPAQALGTVVSYTITATDNTTEATTSSPAQYIVSPSQPVLAVSGPSSGVALQFTCPVGTTATVQFSPGLTPATWLDVASLPGTGAPVEFVESSTTRLALDQGFYRVVITVNP